MRCVMNFKYIIYILLFCFITFSVLAADMIDKMTGQSPSNHLLRYGGEKGDTLFQQDSTKIIESLKQAFILYTKYPTMRKVETLRNLTLNVAEKRASIAQQAGMEDRIQRTKYI